MSIDHEKVLITGGAGYIGSILTLSLLKKKYYVTVLDNFIYSQNSLLECCSYKNFEVIQGDSRDETLIKELVKDKDIIIPLACLVGAPICKKKKIDAKTINLGAIQSLSRLISKSQLVLYPASDCSYGIGPKEKYSTEDTKMRPTTFYGFTKMKAEEILLSRENTVSFRLASAFGVSPRMRIDLLINNLVYRAIIVVFIQIALICSGSWLLLSSTGNTITCIGILLTFLIIYIWNLFDAYKCAKKKNTEYFEKSRKENKDPWLAVFLSQIFPGIGHIYLKKWIWGIIFIFCLFFFSILEDIAPIFLVLGVIFKASICFHAYISSPVHRETSEDLIVILAIIIFVSGLIVNYLPVFIKKNVVQAYRIPSGTMLETIQIGDHILAKKFSYYLKEPQRNDIIIFKYPKDKKRDFIKRVIGLPGETIKIKDKKVFINGTSLDEPYVVFKDIDNIFNKNHPAYYIDPYEKRRDNIGPESIPLNSYFVMGDNRDFSQDSRYWGFVDRELIKGKVYKIYWPPDRIGPIE